jgi:hypothetical protein
MMANIKARAFSFMQQFVLAVNIHKLGRCCIRVCLAKMAKRKNTLYPFYPFTSFYLFFGASPRDARGVPFAGANGSLATNVH